MSTKAKTALEAAKAAFHRYEADAEGDPTKEHRELMEQIDEALSDLQAQGEGDLVVMPSQAHADYYAACNRQLPTARTALEKFFGVRQLMVGALKVKETSGLIYRGGVYPVLGLYLTWPEVGLKSDGWKEYRISLVGTRFVESHGYTETTIPEGDIEWIDAKDWDPATRPASAPDITGLVDIDRMLVDIETVLCESMEGASKLARSMELERYRACIVQLGKMGYLKMPVEGMDTERTVAHDDRIGAISALILDKLPETPEDDSWDLAVAIDAEFLRPPVPQSLSKSYTKQEVEAMVADILSRSLYADVTSAETAEVVRCSSIRTIALHAGLNTDTHG